MPTRRANVPCHVKMDTECIAQLFLSGSDRSTARKNAASRTAYNNWVWERVLKRGVKFARGGFVFHHEITTDGVSVSMLYSRSTPSPENSQSHRCSDEKCSPLQSGIFPSLEVGLDPGKKNIVTMVDNRGVKLGYSTRHRNFESRLTRYRRVLHREKERHGVFELERELSDHCHNTNDASKYSEYLKCKAGCDKRTEEFYMLKKWRNWKFRLYTHRKSSENRLINRIANFYGPDCTLLYGDWSRTDQMKGCASSSVKGMWTLLSKHFKVKTVDEFRTSKTCNVCHELLSRYGADYHTPGFLSIPAVCLKQGKKEVLCG